MSHFVQTKVNFNVERKNALRTALVAMGYKESSIEVSDTPLQLSDYYGKASKQYGHIRVKGKQAGLSADLGFEFKQDGSTVVHGDSMDMRTGWQDKLLQQYSVAVIKEIAEENLFQVTEQETNREGDIFVTVETF